MNIFHAYTRKSLLANRTRTLVTIIGIILSMAMFTAVIEGAYSGQQFLIRSVEEAQGRWLIYESGINAEQKDALCSTDGVKEYACWQEVGWGLIGSKNEYKPYLMVVAMDDRMEDFLAIRLLSGRLPETSDEILLPAHLASNGGVSYHEGDSLSIELGHRTDGSGNLLSSKQAMDDAAPEQLVGATEHQYTVVGIYERLEREVEDYGCPGFTALTRSEQGNGSYTVFYTLKKASALSSWLNAHPAIGNRVVHGDLRRFYGAFYSESITALIYGFAGILVLLIFTGAVSLIYNSFSISVSERTRQFGILKSVGATKKQIQSSVLYEALMLSAVSIPAGLIIGCAGIGITLYCVRDAFYDRFFGNTTTQIRLVLNPMALGIAVLVCLVTTLLSATIPARRAIRITPIDSIRQTADVKLSGRQVQTGKLTQKLLGFEGMLAVKNFKRNRKRYRSTIISLFLSVVLFISASSLCSYIRDSARDVTGIEAGRADIIYQSVGMQRPDPEIVLPMLAEAGEAQEGVYLDMEGRTLIIPTDSIDPEAWRVLSYDPSSYGDAVNLYGFLAFVQDDAFRTLCEENGYDPADFFDPEHPKALAWNWDGSQVEQTAGTRYARIRVLDESAFPCTLSSWKPLEKGGYVYNGIAVMPDGERKISYTPLDDNGEPQWDSPVFFSAEESGKPVEYVVGGVVKKQAFGMAANNFSLYYPYSMEEAVLGKDDLLYVTSYSFLVQNHSRSFNAMKAALVNAGMDASELQDAAAAEESTRLIVTAINVFAYGFIVLISLIAAANVFNTISTNILLRRREFAMLRSVGLDRRSERRIMNYECLIYGTQGLLWGIPVAVGITWVIWKIAGIAVDSSFYIPWLSVVIAVGSVFAVVFMTMLYASAKLRRDNPIDALKNENL